MKYIDYTDSLRDYVYSQWATNGIFFTIQVALSLLVLYFVFRGIRLRWIHRRTGKMTPRRYREWQLSVLAGRFVDAGEKLIDDRIFSRRDMNALLEQIGHRNSIPDLVPKERVERIPVATLKALIRGRLRNPPPKKKENESLGTQLGEKLHQVVNGYPKPGDK